jgi:hypothetical protein
LGAGGAGIRCLVLPAKGFARARTFLQEAKRVFGGRAFSGWTSRCLFGLEHWSKGLESACRRMNVSASLSKIREPFCTPAKISAGQNLASLSSTWVERAENGEDGLYELLLVSRKFLHGRGTVPSSP